MDILVCIKQVPESNKVEVDPVTGVLQRNAASKMNPYDLFALETALRLKEEHGGHVSVMTMGPPQAERVVREAYAMGADEGYLMTDRRFGGADVLATSYTLAQGIRQAGPFDLILCGKQTTDGDTAQVGSEISEALGLPALAGVTEILCADGKGLTVRTDLLDKMLTVQIPFPCLLSVEQDIVQPRLPSYVRRQATKDRPVRRLTLDDLTDTDPLHYGLNGSPTQVQRIFPPDIADQRERWDGAGDELAARLYRLLKEQKLWHGGR